MNWKIVFLKAYNKKCNQSNNNYLKFKMIKKIIWLKATYSNNKHSNNRHNNSNNSYN